MNTAKEKRAIQYLQSFEPQSEPYYLCYSGGKDSDCIRILAQLAGVRHDIVHNLTTVDAPETVRYVRSISGVQIERPEKTMWELIVEKKIPPTRLLRYCCKKLKEHGGKGRVKVTGVRWDESKNRSDNHGVVTVIGKPKTMQRDAEDRDVDYRVNRQGGLVMNDDNAETRRFVEHCYRTTSTMVNPIVDWTDADVWEFLHHYGCQSNPLYQCWDSRVGCIGCPMQGFGGMKADFARWPQYKQIYIHAFDRMLEARDAAGKPRDGLWLTGEDVFLWWIGEDPRQISLFDDEMEDT